MRKIFMKEWGRFQQEIGAWQAAIFPKGENTPRLAFGRAEEEIKELDYAIIQEVNQEIGEEAVDVIIRMMGIAAIVGVHVEDTLAHKIAQTTKHKYPPSLINVYKDMGDDTTGAMRRAKTVWQRKEVGKNGK